MTGIFRAVLSISAATILSRVTGYARTMVQAAVLELGLVANAYNAAGALPNQIYELFLGGILYSIFIPILVGRIASHGEEDAKQLTNALLTLILPILAGVTLLGVVFAEPIVLLATDFGAQELSPEEAGQTTDLAVLFFRIFILQLLFYGVGTITTGVLQAHRRFFLPTFVPVLTNLIVIASFGGYALLAPERQVPAQYVLGGGATFGVVVMYGVLLVAMYRLGYRPQPRLRHPALLQAARLAGPMIVFVAASVGLQLYANYLATQFNVPTALFLAFTVFSLPYGVFVVSIATAIMPELSEQHARGDIEAYRETFSFGLRTTAFVSVAATVGLVALALPITGLLYERGRFGPAETATVASLLVAYSVGLLGFAIYFVLVRGFFSRQNTRTPATLNVVLFVVYVVLAYSLSRTGLEAVGIALALSLANAALAAAGLAATRRDIKRLQGRRILRSLAKMLVAGAVMYAVAFGGTSLLGTGSNTPDRLAILAVVGGASLAAYLATAYALKAEELSPAVALIKRRFARA